MNPSSEPMDRRAFAGRLIRLFTVLLCAAAAVILALFITPRRIRDKKIIQVPVCDVRDLPGRGVRAYSVPFPRGETTVERNVFVVQTETELFCLSPVCTHLGCLVSWHWSKNRFLCPCHGGQFDMEGQVVAGPPRAPLARLPLFTENNRIYVGIEV
jgi:Rieske Fe-S protein